MSATVRLIYNAIIAGKWYSAGDPIPKEILPDKLRQFIEKPAPKSPPPDEPEERNLMLHYNQRYSVDEDGFLRPAVARQAAELQVRAQDEEALADELAEAEISPQVAAAIAQGQEDYAADVAVQAANARVQAEHADAAQEFVREEQDEKVAAGEI